MTSPAHCLHLNSMRHMFIRYGRESPTEEHFVSHFSPMSTAEVAQASALH